MKQDLRNPRHLLPAALIAVLLWLAKSAFIVAVPLRALAMSTWLIDDSFIIMRIARNLALGKGYSFDGVNLTSGAPPLWTTLSAANHLFFGPETAAKAALIESALCGAAATLLVFYLAWRVFDAKVAWGAFLFSSFSLPLFFNAMNGMETALFTLLGLLALCLAERAQKLDLMLSHITDLDLQLSAPKTRLGWGKGACGPFWGLGQSPRKKSENQRSGAAPRWHFATGAVLGLTHLVRADGIFLTFAVILLALWPLRQQSPATRKAYITRALAPLLAGAVLFTLPLLLWSLHTGGALIPANQAGRRFIAWQSATRADGSIIWPTYIKIGGARIPELFTLLAMVVGSAFVAILALISGVLRQRGARFSRLVALYLLSYCGALVVYQGYFPDVHGLRYLNLPAHLLSIVLVAFCFRVIFNGPAEPDSKPKRAARWALLAGMLATLLAFGGYAYMELSESMDWAQGFKALPIYDEAEVDQWWAFIDWSVENLPEGAVVAAKDHGRLAYFTEVRVVDLAGIIDPMIITHFRDETLDIYLEAQGVQYVVLPDAPTSGMLKAVHDALTLARVIGAPPQEASGYTLYRVLP